MHILDAAWMLVKTLNFSSLALVLTGVAVFGWFFVRHNAIAAQGETNEIPPESWRGAGAIRGLLIMAGGAGLQIASILLAAFLPGRA